ncbi:hypothetical protein JTM17_35670, partial [Pseudomonas aeruginosa]|nr:hypothetical protein [Pseudomonas aeruginosa]
SSCSVPPAAAAGAPAEDAVEAAVAAAAAFGLINGTVVTRRTGGSVALTEGSAAGIFVVGGAFTGAGDTVMSAGAGGLTGSGCSLA